MQPELITPDYEQSEMEERAIRRADLIRKRYGSLGNFLKMLEDADQSKKSECAHTFQHSSFVEID